MDGSCPDPNSDQEENKIGDDHVNGVLYTFTKIGEIVFYCAAGNGAHCAAGQIVTFNVVSPDDATESPSSSPTMNRIIQFAGNPCRGLSGDRGNCIACTGDCDDDSECLGDLRCAQRNRWDGLEEVPGCSFLSGDPSKTTNYDFCFEPQSVDAGVANYVGECGADNGYLCGECEGDCDTSDDCEPGLICMSRSGLETVGGCTGGQSTDMYGKDICVRQATSSPSPSLAPSKGFTPTNMPSKSPTSSPVLVPTASPTDSPSESPSMTPSRLQTVSPTSSPTPQSYRLCRTRNRNRKKRVCLRTSGCRWITGVHWTKRCQPITPAPTPMPSRSPTNSPSSSPTSVMHSLAKADVLVTCPFDSAAVENSMKSKLISELQTDGLSVDISITILSDVSCTDAARRLESSNVEALIESIVIIRDGSSSYSPSLLVDAVTNIKGDAYTVSNSELIESPSSAPSASPSSSPSSKPTVPPTKAPTTTDAPTFSPTANPTPLSYRLCRTRNRNKKKKLCIRTSGCRWVRGVHWTKRCQPISSN